MIRICSTIGTTDTHTHTVILVGKPQGKRAFGRSRSRWAGSQMKTNEAME